MPAFSAAFAAAASVRNAAAPLWEGNFAAAPSAPSVAAPSPSLSAAAAAAVAAGVWTSAWQTPAPSSVALTLLWPFVQLVAESTQADIFS